MQSMSSEEELSEVLANDIVGVVIFTEEGAPLVFCIPYEIDDIFPDSASSIGVVRVLRAASQMAKTIGSSNDVLNEIRFTELPNLKPNRHRRASVQNIEVEVRVVIHEWNNTVSAIIHDSTPNEQFMVLFIAVDINKLLVE
eukprot:TRINITY_DN915_c0_g1_i4.p1 TRINITY_DN915_c0_g1~~TRINITY_DN915_c0_g1_i4.p1  ORF type:complete len:141 (+),score=34.44 TRINITY_DN915_c0_g1_i4:36-458(+)